MSDDARYEDEDSVLVEEKSSDNANLLLAAAEDLKLEPEVVRTTTDGFLVPKKVYDKAGLGKSKASTSKAAAKDGE